MARRVLAIRGQRQLGAHRREAQTAATMMMARVVVARAKAALAVKLVKAQAASEAACYVLGLMQGAFFTFHLLTKPFPSRDQPPIHLDHMTSHMPFQSPAPQSHAIPVTCSSKSPCPISPAPKSPAHHLILPHLTSHDPIPIPDSSLFAYLSFASGFSARLLYFPHKPRFTTYIDSLLVTFTRESVPQYMTPSFGL